MSLTDNQKKHLRGLGHALKPVVTTGAAGLTPAVAEEIRTSLAHHELMKIKVRADERADRDALIEAICRDTGAELVQRIGHVALLWRPNPERRRVPLPPR